MQTLDRIQRIGSQTAGPLAARSAFAVVVLVSGAAAWAYSAPADLEAPRQLAETKIRTALSPEMPPAQRNQLLTEATALLKAIVARRAEAEMPPEELLKHFRLRLRLIETIGLLRSEEYAFRLLHLRGEEADRRRAVWAMGYVRTTGSIVAVLTRFLEDESAVIRAVAARSLGEHGRAAGSAAFALTRLLGDDDPGVRSAAAAAIRKVDPGR